MGSPTTIIRRARAAAARGARSPRRRRGLARLQARGDARACAIAAAVATTLSGDRPQEERDWAGRIEGLRRELLASTDTLTVHAYEYTGDARDHESEVHTVGETCRTASRPPLWSRLLMALVAELRPQAALELGTCLGVSAAYQGAALELAGTGRLVTLDASRSRTDLARANLERLGLAGRVEIVTGRFQETLEPTLERLGVVDYAFIDGHHDERATIAYFEQIVRHLAPGAVGVVDDIVWSEGMTRAWRAIAGDARVGLAIDLGGVGLCVVGGGGEPELVDLPLT